MTKKLFIKAEMWDKMQFLFRNYYDRTIHCVLYYDGMIDEHIMGEAIKKLVDQVPVLHSKFCNNPIRPFWVVKKYDMEDILKVIDTDDVDKVADEFVCQTIPYNKNVQCKLGLIRDGKRSVVVLLLNHMCSDGGDFKYLIAKLIAFYNQLATGKGTDFSIKQGSRSYRSVYTKLNEEEKKIANGLYKNVSVVKDKHQFPWSEKSASDKNMICRHKLPIEMFDRLKEKGAAHKATINDLFLAAYIRSLFELAGYDKNDTLAIPNMVDLRRHIVNDGADTGITNHTGFMVCKVEGVGETVFDTLEKVKASIAESKNDKFLGLYSLPLLHLAYTIFPQFISEIAIRIGYVNPLIGISNIGVLKADALKLSGLKLTDAYLTGAVKYKPFVQLATTTLNKEITFTVAIRGNEKDRVIIGKFFELLDKNLNLLTA